MRKQGAFCWNELASTDPPGAMRFYAESLGWMFQAFDLPEGPYWVASVGDQMVGGLGGLDTAADRTAVSSMWFAFIEVSDLDARVALALTLGASVIQEPHHVPNVGRVAVLRDPTGAVIGWMTGAS